MSSATKMLVPVGFSGLLLLVSGCVVSSGLDNGGETGIEGRGTGGTRATGGQGGASTGGVSPSGGGGGDGGAGPAYFSLTDVTINASLRSGEVALSGQLGIAEGELAFVLSSIKDPEDATQPAASERVEFAVSVDGATVECEVAPTGDTQAAPVDVVFINDTTGSMAGTVNGISDSVREFAASIAESGIDARFAMVTYGDEFSTLQPAESAYVEGQAEYEASSVDSASRPYVPLTTLETFETFLAELQGSDDLGAGGGDGPENTLGALEYAIDGLSWREGAARVFVAIGDNPAHTAESVTEALPDLDAHFLPPAVDELLAFLDGTAVVHVVGNDWGSEPYYNLKGLSDATGGAFIELPSDGVVDLTGMKLNNWVGSTYFGVCFGVQPGDREVVIAATVTGDEGDYEGAVSYDVTLE